MLEKKPITIETRYIPIIPKPTLPNRPRLNPEIPELFPETIAITRQDVLFYDDACDAWNSGEFSEDEIIEEYGLSESSACNWVIFGNTLQDRLTMESVINELTGHVLILNNYIDYLILTIGQMSETAGRAADMLSSDDSEAK